MNNITFCGNLYVVRPNRVDKIETKKSADGLSNTDFKQYVNNGVLKEYELNSQKFLDAYNRAFVTGYGEYNTSKTRVNKLDLGIDAPSYSEEKERIKNAKTNNIFKLVPKYELDKNGRNIDVSTLGMFDFRNNELTDREQGLVDAIDEAFEKIEPLSEDTTFCCAMSSDFVFENINGPEVGSVTKLSPGYAIIKNDESSIDPENANKHRGSDTIFLEINCQKGSKVSVVPQKHLREVKEVAIMPRAAEFIVTGKEIIPCAVKGSENVRIPVLKYTLEYIGD